MKITQLALTCALSFAAASANAQPAMSSAKSQSATTMLEIRCYNLKPGTRSQFHTLMVERSMPLLQKWNMEVVAFGPSAADEDTYFLIRAFHDLDDRQKQEDAFYGSDDWRKGPREQILALIENYTTMIMPESAREALLSKLQQGKRVNTGSDREQLSALNAQFIRNFVNNDTIHHHDIIHPDFIYISASGKIIERKQYLKNWAHAFDKAHDKIDYFNESIRIFGTTALVRCNTTYSEIQNGKLIHGRTVYTDTYIKENNRWWCVQAQITEEK